LALEHDLDVVKMNQHAKYLGQMSFCLIVIVRTQTNAPGRLHYTFHWSVNTETRKIFSIEDRGQTDRVAVLPRPSTH